MLISSIYRTLEGSTNSARPLSCAVTESLKVILLFYQPKCFRMTMTMARLVNSMNTGPMPTSLALKWVPWPEVMLCGIQEMVSPQKAVVAEALTVGPEGKPYPE